MLSNFFLGFIIAALASCSASALSFDGVEDFDIDMAIYSRVDGENKIPRYLHEWSIAKGINLVLAPSGEEISDLNDFFNRYRKQKTISDWVVIFEEIHDIELIERIADENDRMYKRFSYKGFSHLKEKGLINTYNSDGNAFNISLSNICGFMVKNNEDLNKVTVKSGREITGSKLCESFPVILGASGILLYVEDGKLAFKGVNIKKNGN